MELRNNFNFQQQVYGPLQFSVDKTLTLKAGRYTDIENNLIFRFENIR